MSHQSAWAVMVLLQMGIVPMKCIVLHGSMCLNSWGIPHCLDSFTEGNVAFWVGFLQFPVPLERYTSPPEDNLNLLRHYFRTLVTGALRNTWCPVLYVVAVAHVNSFIFSQDSTTQVGKEYQCLRAGSFAPGIPQYPLWFVGGSPALDLKTKIISMGRGLCSCLRSEIWNPHRRQ